MYVLEEKEKKGEMKGHQMVLPESTTQTLILYWSWASIKEPEKKNEKNEKKLHKLISVFKRL